MNHFDEQRLQFYGDVTIEQSPGDAIAAAKPNGTSDPIARLGAAVVNKSLDGSQGWEVRRYSAISKERNSHKAETFAIAQSAAVAIELIMHLRHQIGDKPDNMATNDRVTIFSDCRSALEQVNHLREKDSGVKAKACSDPNICKLIMGSQRLHQMEVDLELCWVPGHVGVEGNVRAHKAAQQAARTQDITVQVDEGPQWIELEVSSEE
ncbi:hypothetical protein HDV63DRAFT_410941 [Trichoderma sp. SZMC 28014]